MSASVRWYLTVLCATGVFGVAASACSASPRVAPGGADAGDCVSEACGSFAYAYQRSRDGDVIEVAPGVYGPQIVPEGTKDITFRGAPGAKVRRLENSASNITFDGVDVDAEFAELTTAAFENHGEPGGQNVTFENARIGNVVDQKGALLGGSSNPSPTSFIFDNVEFHDVLHRADGVHNECLMAHAPGITIRNSTFRNCATMDISLGRGDWWGQPPYGNVTLENNVFGHSTNDGTGWHYYGLAWFVGKFENARVVNNTFENAVGMESQHVGPGPYSGVWANNIGGGWQCLPGVTYRNNLGKRCHPSDRALTPESSCGPPACAPARTLPVGWVDPAGDDFHLRAGSPAIDAGDSVYATATDKDGRERGGKPDAGAYEFGEGSAASRGLPVVRSARLRPRAICRRPRRGCPSSARLRMRLSRPARVTVRVERLRRGRQPKRVRTLNVAPRQRPVARLRARTLRRGRYRLLVVAADGAGLRSAPRLLELRVR